MSSSSSIGRKFPNCIAIRYNNSIEIPTMRNSWWSFFLFFKQKTHMHSSFRCIVATIRRNKKSITETCTLNILPIISADISRNRSHIRRYYWFTSGSRKPWSTNLCHYWPLSVFRDFFIFFLYGYQRAMHVAFPSICELLIDFSVNIAGPVLI